MSRIFISYSRQSRVVARSLAGDIEALGHTVWLDQELSGGQSWWDQILTIVRDCDVFVFVLDPDGLSSAACKLEFGYAHDLGKPILPVLVAEGVSTNLLPPALSLVQFVDYAKQDRTAAFALARALAVIPPTKPLPDPLPPPPDAPVSYLGGLGSKVDKSASLSYEEQSALLVDLRRSLRDPVTAGDARALLGRLRIRRDLFAAIAEEIDELPGIRKPAPAPALPDRPVQEPPPKVEDVKPLAARQETPPPPVTNKIVTPRDRQWSACAGAVVGAVWWFGALLILINSNKFEDILGVVFMGALAGSIPGAIIARRKTVALIALCGAFLGFVAWRTLIGGSSRDAYMSALALGTFLGAVVGAVVGAFAVRKRWT